MTSPHRTHRHPAKAAGLLLLLAGLSACYGLRPAVVPLHTLPLAESGSDCLVVLLPGRGDAAEDFRRADFAAIAAAHGVAADVVAVDAHMGYYRERTVTERLHDDVVAPALARGQRVWLVGISLGGLGALLYTADHPGEVEGVVLLSPFLGKGAVLDEVEAAGRLADWTGASDPVPGERPQGDELWRRLWTLVRRLTGDDPAAPDLVLAYGRDDRLARSLGLLARELPPDHVLRTAGGHDWATWTGLWQQLTARGIPACAPP